MRWVLFICLVFLSGCKWDSRTVLEPSYKYDEQILTRNYSHSPVQNVVDWWIREGVHSDFLPFIPSDEYWEIGKEQCCTGVDWLSLLFLRACLGFEREPDKGKIDYWQSSWETIDRGMKGDCEDFAILFYVEACRRGLLPPDRSGIVAVYVLSTDTYHAMVFYYPDESEDDFICMDDDFGPEWVSNIACIPIYAFTLNEFWRYGPY